MNVRLTRSCTGPGAGNRANGSSPANRLERTKQTRRVTEGWWLLIPAVTWLMAVGCAVERNWLIHVDSRPPGARIIAGEDLRSGRQLGVAPCHITVRATEGLTPKLVAAPAKHLTLVAWPASETQGLHPQRIRFENGEKLPDRLLFDLTQPGQ